LYVRRKQNRVQGGNDVATTTTVPISTAQSEEADHTTDSGKVLETSSTQAVQST
ncbi:hypothetical protein HAX54_034803, partial [Datura stramonium]|nr:hypothetical protein [Datura stramonium]